MRKLLSTWLTLCCCLSLMAQQWHFHADIRHPAEYSYLSSSPRVLIVNNTTPQPPTFGHSTGIDGNQQPNDSVSLVDAARHCLIRLTQGLEQSEEFLLVELLDHSQNNSGLYYTRHLLTYDQQEELCRQYEVDALLVLNQIVLYDIQENFALRDNASYFAYQTAYSQAHWTVHYAGQMDDRTFTSADTLNWESDHQPSRQQALQAIPDRQQALLYLAEITGEDVALSLTPSWETVTRYLYDTSDTTLLAGLQSFRLRRWQDAIACWQPLLTATTPRTAASAAANTAVAYEMNGDLRQAYQLTQQAITLWQKIRSSDARQQVINLQNYLSSLSTRLDENL